MKLYPKQLKRFWNKQDGWPAIVRAHNWPADQAEQQRRAMLQRAGFDSLTLVDPVKGFTRVLLEMDALRDDLGGMVEHTDEANALRVAQHNIRSTGLTDAYINAIAADRFGIADWQSLTGPSLQSLMKICANRSRAKKKPAAPVLVEDNIPF